MFTKRTLIFASIVAIIVVSGELGSGDLFGIKAAFGYGGGEIFVSGAGSSIYYGNSTNTWASTPTVTANGLVGSTMSMTINPGQDGTLTQNFNGDIQARLHVPTGAVTGQTSFNITGGYFNSQNTPVNSAGAFLVGGQIFNINATDANGSAVTSFSKYLTIGFTLPAMPSSAANLGVYYFNASTGQWVLVPGSVFDVGTRTVSFEVNHLTTFAVFDIMGTPIYFNSINLPTTPTTPSTPWTPTTPTDSGSLKIYADGTLIRGSNNRVYVIDDQMKYWLRNWEELKKYTGQPIYDVSDAVIAAYPETSIAPNDMIGLPNPASSFCIEQGGKLEIRTSSDGSQWGVCKFINGRECEEWAYFKGDCDPNDYSTSQPIVSKPVEKGKYVAGMLIRGTDHRVYIINKDNKRVYIPSLAELGAYRGKPIYNVSNDVVNSFLEAPALSEGNLVRKMDMKIYVIKNGIKYHIKNLTELMQYAGQKVYNVIESAFGN